jgi:hypothetical protein
MALAYTVFNKFSERPVDEQYNSPTEIEYDRHWYKNNEE